MKITRTTFCLLRFLTLQSNWLDAKADRSDAGHRRRLRTLGALLALSVTNSCRFPVELPDLFFRWLLLDGGGGGSGGGNGGPGGQAGNGRTPPPSSSSSPLPLFQPSVADMVALDPSLAQPFEALTDAVQSKDALEGLLEIEGLPADTPAGEYISHMVRQTFLDPVQWQVTEVREAFFRALLPAPPEAKPSERSSQGGSGRAALAAILPRPAVLAEIIRGDSPVVGDSSFGGDGGGRGLSPPALAREPGVAATTAGRAAGKPVRDFDFKEAFAVYEDRDLVACAPLREVKAGSLPFVIAFLFPLFHVSCSDRKREKMDIHRWVCTFPSPPAFHLFCHAHQDVDGVCKMDSCPRVVVGAICWR